MDPDTACPSAQQPLRVRLFARLREQAGWSERALALHTPGQPAPTAALVWRQLRLGPWPPGVRVAVNQEFGTPHQPLQPGDEVAFLPPITGG